MLLAPGEIGTPPTVLIVSDNPKLMGMLSRFLSRQGMVTLSADSGPRCLEKVLHQGAIDVIVLEMMMALPPAMRLACSRGGRSDTPHLSAQSNQERRQTV